MKKITLFTFLTILLCTSCVTKKKFMLAELAATASKDSLQGLLTDCRNTGNQMSVQIKNLMRDTTKMGNSIRQYQSMLNVNMTEQEKLNALLNQKKNELNERERTINELQQMINAQNEKSVCPSINTSISVCLFSTSANLPRASSPRLSRRALPDWNNNLSDIATYTFPSFSRTVSSSLLKPNNASFTLLNSFRTFSFYLRRTYSD